MFHRTVLSSGLRVYSVPMPGYHSVTVGIFASAGSRYETDGIAGASHFLEHMLFKGTARWPTARAISEAIEGVGGMFNAFTDRELTGYWVKVARPHFPRALDVLADMMLNPAMDAEELEKERRVIVEELNMTNDSPHGRADLLLEDLMWPNQPMGRDVGGSKDTVLRMPREEIIRYMRDQYVPNNMIMAVAGDLEHEQVVSHVEKALAELRSGTARPMFPVQDVFQGPAVKVEYRKTDQAHMTLGFHGYSRTHPDRHALDLFSVLLGEGMSSRLFVEMREKRALVYDVHSGAGHYRDCGVLNVSCGVDPKRAPEALEVLLGEFERVKTDVSAEELLRAKELAKARLLLRNEDTRAMCMWVGSQELLIGSAPSVEETLGKIELVTPEDVMRVAKDVLRRERMAIVVVGPLRTDAPFVRLATGNGPTRRSRVKAPALAGA